MSQPRIVLVDDDSSVRSALAFALGVEGFDVVGFAGAEALLADGSARDAACLVIDQRLPRMDGLTLLARLRADGVTAPAVIITSNPSRTLAQRVEQSGASLIEKPILHDALLQTIRLLIAG